MKSKCPYCNYEWESRIDNPKECPRCKRRLDHKKEEVKNG